MIVLTKNMISLDLTPFMSLALATNPLILNGIDELYEEYKFLAYEQAKKSKFYTHPLLVDGSIKREVYCKRALGLLCLNDLKKYEELDSGMLDLFTKGWNSLYRYVLNTDVMDIDHVMKNIILNKEDDDYFVAFTTVLLLFSEVFEKKIKPESFKSDMGVYFNHYLSHFELEDTRFSFNFVKNDKELYRKAKSITSRFYENFVQLKTTSDLVDLAIINDELADFCRSVNVVFDADDMALSSMSDNMKVSKKHIIELAGLYYIHNKNQNRLESGKFILFGLHLKYSIKSYKELKKYYFQNNKETLFIELEGYINDIEKYKEENLILKRQLEALESENIRLKKEYKDSIEKDNILLKRENLKFKESISLFKKEINDLKELSESFFEVDEKIIEEDILIEVPDVNGVIAGGHSSWHSKLKEILPSEFIFIEGDNEKFDERLLDNKDHIFIYTKYMSHAFYYKLMEKCRRTGISFSYISHTSPNYVKRQIKDILLK